MGTITWLILHFILKFNDPYEYLLLCLLVSIDSLTFVQLFSLLKKRKRA